MLGFRIVGLSGSASFRSFVLTPLSHFGFEGGRCDGLLMGKSDLFTLISIPLLSYVEVLG